jgi:hypothetical protein
MALPPCAMVARLAVCAAIAAHTASAQTPLSPGVLVTSSTTSCAVYSLAWPGFASTSGLNITLTVTSGDLDLVLFADTVPTLCSVAG